MQFQADILGIPVIRSAIPETTALGAAYLAGLHTGYWKSKKDIEKNWRMAKKFEPNLDSAKRKEMIRTWKYAVKAARHFTELQKQG